MKQPREAYPKAIVPEHLTKLSIEKLPFDHTYYIEPGEEDDYQPPAIYTSPDRRLVMSKNHAIDLEDEFPASPIGLVGVAKTYLINPSTNAIHEYFIADLRFISDHQLVSVEDIAPASSQEEYMAMVNELENSITFSAFIAAEGGDEIHDSGKVAGTFYGDPMLYEALKKMNKQGNKQMKKFLRRQKRSTMLAKSTINATDKIEQSPVEQHIGKSQEAKDLSVQFLKPQ